MIVLGLDIATTTGWALHETIDRRANRVRIECGSFKSSGSDHVEQCSAMANSMIALLKRLRGEGRQPELVAMEAPLLHKAVSQRRTARSEFLAPAFHGAAVAIIAAYRVPMVAVAPQTWRLAFCGEGVRPPKSVPKGKTRDWWKREVRLRADLLGEDLGFIVKNNDVSDAIGVAFWGVNEALRLRAYNRRAA